MSAGKDILKEFAFGDDYQSKASQSESMIEKNLRAILTGSSASAADKQRAQKTLDALEEKKLFKALEDTIRSDEKLAQLDIR